MPVVRSWWAPDDPAAARLEQPRDDVVLEERQADGSFTAADGPFRHYRRTLSPARGGTEQRVEFRLAVPWFGWLYLPLARRALRAAPPRSRQQPWWAPPDRLDPRAATVLGLLAATALVVGYLNTLFTQTVAFAADDFGVSEGAQGVAGTIVRFGIVFSLGLVFLADRRGRRRVLAAAVVAGPLLCASGALAPSFWALTATQTLGRPVAIALGLVVGIVAAEEMPSGSRAYAISVLAMATGLGAGLCVMALPLADLSASGWRLIYVVPLLFLVIAWDVHRRLPESRRFALPHAASPPWQGRRFALLAASGFLTNLLVAPASFFGNRYLKDVRHYSATKIAAFTLVTNTPGGVGVLAGGRLADVHGRRIVGAVALIGGTLGTVAMFVFNGSTMWLASMLGAIIGGAAVPALGVYGAELFPTGHRGKASGLISLLSLIGSSLGLLFVGWVVDRGLGYGAAIGIMAIGPLLVAVLVMVAYPETAHHELEDLNPEDRLTTPSATSAAAPPSGESPAIRQPPSEPSDPARHR